MATRRSISALYLTSGDEQHIQVIQGTTVNQFNEVHQSEYPIAVNSTIRTLGLGPGQTGAEYTLGGTPTGTNYAFPALISNAYDGATDGTHNYTVDYTGGGVYQLGLDWTNPVLLFNTPQFQLGITYDPLNNSLWVGGWGSGQISDFTLGGTLLSSFAAPVATIASLAMDYADGTLWFGTQDDIRAATRTFYQFSTAGIGLGTEQYAALAEENYLGGEFALQASSDVPEPATLLLLGTGLFGPGLMRRRKAA